MVSPSFHLALHVADLQRSIAFYGELFGIAPAKVRTDYAKFELAEPPLVLSLNPSVLDGGAEAQRLSHMGVRVSSRGELESIRTRLVAAGLSLRDEGETECCYALQNKFWVADPDGNDWEFYEFLADSEQLAGSTDRGETVCCPTSVPASESAPGSSGACC